MQWNYLILSWYVVLALLDTKNPKTDTIDIVKDTDKGENP